MNKLKFKTFAALAIVMTSLSLISCDKDEPTPSPEGGQHHFLFVQYLDNKAAYIGTFSDLSQQTVDNKMPTNLALVVIRLVIKISFSGRRRLGRQNTQVCKKC